MRIAHVMAVVVAALVCLQGAPARAESRAEVTLSVTPSTGSESDEFTATVQVSVLGVQTVERYTAPEFTAFEILEERTQPVSTQWTHGKAGAEIRNVEIRRYRLRPRRAGTLRIGPATVKVAGREFRSAPIWINVLEDGEAAPAADASAADGAPVGETPVAPPDETVTPKGDTFLRAVVKPTDVYVGAQISVEWLLYSRSDVLKFEPKPPNLEGFWVEKLFDPEDFFTYREEVAGGRTYAVATVSRRALFPTRPGKLTIQPFRADVSTLHTSIGAPLALASEAVEVRVRPLPTGAPPGFDASYVGRFKVRASVDRESVPAGESLTLTFEVSGSGALRRTPAPEIELDAFRVTAPTDFEETVNLEGNEVTGTRRYVYLLTPRVGGEISIPPIELPYFDPTTGKYEVARSEPIAVRVEGDPERAFPEEATGVIGKDIRPLREVPSLRSRVVSELALTDLYWLLVLLPGTTYVLVAGIDGLRRRLRKETPRARLRRARGKARRRLRFAELHIRGGRPAKFFGEMSGVLNDHIEERVGEPVSAMTREQLSAFLLTREFPVETVEEIIKELDHCDLARFAPSAHGPGEMKAAKRRVQNILASIEKVRPTGVEVKAS